MSSGISIKLPEKVEELKAFAIDQAERIARLEQEIRLKDEIIRLERLKKYGPKSEKLSEDQMLLLEDEPGVSQQEVEEEAERPEKKPRRKRRNPKPGRLELPGHLERVEEIVPCTPEQCRCGQCGSEKKLIGFETAEVLEVKPAEYYVKVTKREKRACGSCSERGVSTAPAPARIVEKSKFSDEFIVDVLIKKYRDHLPLYRQSEALAKDVELEVDRSTLCHLVMKAGELCSALSRAMKPELFRGGYIQADETPVGVQSPKTRGKNHQAYLFEYSRPYGPVIFELQMGRGRDGPRNFLKGFKGKLQCDGYAGYNEFDNELIERIGCLSHVRRKFYDAHKLASKDPRPLDILERIKPIYRIEEEAREAAMNSDQRKALRQEKSTEPMASLKQRIIEIAQEALPASQLGKACTYALNQWSRVEKFLEYGEVEVDNNWCENGIRPIALGRKNWLHIGSEAAGPKVAGIISIISTCQRLGIDTRQYLLAVLPGLANRKQSELPELTPMAWKARQNAS